MLIVTSTGEVNLAVDGIDCERTDHHRHAEHAEAATKSVWTRDPRLSQLVAPPTRSGWLFLYFFSGGFHSPFRAPLMPPFEETEIFAKPKNVTAANPTLNTRAGPSKLFEIFGT